MLNHQVLVAVNFERHYLRDSVFRRLWLGNTFDKKAVFFPNGIKMESYIQSRGMRNEKRTVSRNGGKIEFKKGVITKG